MAEKVCRKCMRLIVSDKCEICESTDLAEEWFGLLVVVDPLKSVIAKRMNYTLADRYALKVR